MYPNKKQKKKLCEWFGACRWTYNKCVEFSNKNKETKLTKKVFRENFIRSKSITNKTSFLNNIPYDIRDEAMNDFLKNVRSNIAKMKKNKNLKKFKMRFKSKKYDTDNIVIRGRDFFIKKERCLLFY